MPLTKIDDRGLTTPIDLQDSEQIRVGTGNDLLIYHDGNHSQIRDVGTGNLNLGGNNLYLMNGAGSETYISCINNGAVNLYHNNSLMLETTSGGARIVGNLQLDADNRKAIFGSSNDLEIYHDGTVSHIHDDSSSVLQLTNNDIRLKTSGDETMVRCIANDAVKLYYDNSTKFETLSDGVNVTGTLKINGSAISTGGLGNVVEDTTPQLGGDLQSNGNDIDFADNDKAIFGDGSDLSIYHDGSNSYIRDSGTGNLNIDSSWVNIHNPTATEVMARFYENGAVKLYYDNSQKFETTSAGATVTGTLRTGDGSTISFSDNVNLEDSSGSGNNRIKLGAGDDLSIYHSGSASFIDHDGTGNLVIRSTASQAQVYGTEVLLMKQNGIEKMFRGVADGAAELYYDNSKKLETTSSGVTVTGGITSTSGNIIASDGGVSINGTGGATLYLNDSDDNPDYQVRNTAGVFSIYDGTNSANRFVVNTDGHVDIAGNLDVGAGVDVTGSLTVSGAITENVYAITDATSPALDPDNGMIQTWTLNTGSISGTRTPSDSITAGQSMLLMIDDGDGTDAVTFPTMTWAGGSAPTLATSGYTVIELWKVSSTLYGTHVGNVA